MQRFKQQLNEARPVVGWWRSAAVCKFGNDVSHAVTFVCLEMIRGVARLSCLTLDHTAGIAGCSTSNTFCTAGRASMRCR